MPTLSDAARLPGRRRAYAARRPPWRLAMRASWIALAASGGWALGDSVFALNAALMAVRWRGHRYRARRRCVAEPNSKSSRWRVQDTPQAACSRVKSLVRLGAGAMATLDRALTSCAVKGCDSSEQSGARPFSLADRARLDHVRRDRQTHRPGCVAALDPGSGCDWAPEAELVSFAYVAGGGLAAGGGLLLGRFLRASTARGRKPRSAVQRCSKAATMPIRPLVVEHVAPGCQSREFFKHIRSTERRPACFRARSSSRPGRKRAMAG